jgi:hypothetical protein
MSYVGPYSVASKDIVFESFDGDSVVLDLTSGKYFGFSDSGSCIWEALSAGVPASDLVGLTTRGGFISEADLDAFIVRLTELNLLTRAQERAPAALAPELAARLAEATAPLTTDVYDDLADLVMVDPIHDVEEPAGWPAVKQAP